MPRIERSIEIDAPADQVLEYANKLENQIEWVSFMREQEITTTPGAEGMMVERSVVQIGPRKEALRALFKAPATKQVLSRTSDNSSFRMDSQLSVGAIGDMAEVTWTIAYVPPMGAIGKLGDIIMMRRLFINEVEKSLENLKEQLEQPVS